MKNMYEINDHELLYYYCLENGNIIVPTKELIEELKDKFLNNIQKIKDMEYEKTGSGL